MSGLAVILAGLMALLGVSLAPVEKLAGRMGQPPKQYRSMPTIDSKRLLPTKSGEEEFTLQSRSALAIDLVTGEVLFEKNPSEQLPIASITKLVTAMVIIRDHNLDEVVTIPPLPAYGPADAKMGLVAGQTYKLSELLEATLVPSANDAADALAIWDSGTLPAFSAKMNDLVREWGVSGPNFASPSGLQDENNHASARDLIKIAKIALSNTEIRKLASSPQASINDLGGQLTIANSTNRLLGNRGIKGLKTGYTVASGQSFMALADVEGQEVVTVVLNSPDRFQETVMLLEWIERNWQWL